jgi:hypothetical protein
MRRILLLMTLALILAAAMALSGVAQAKTTIGGPTAAQCKNLAIKTLGKGFDPSGYAFVAGTAGDDRFSNTFGLPEVFCGFGGDDGLFTLEAGDVYLGGDGNDELINNFGTFYGGAGDDFVSDNFGGTFYGEAGNDTVTINYEGGTFVQ